MNFQKEIKPYLVTRSNNLCADEVVASRLVFNTIFDPSGERDFSCNRFGRRDRALDRGTDRESVTTFYADSSGAKIKEFDIDRITGNSLDFEQNVLPV